MLGSLRSKKEADPLGRSVAGKIFRVKWGGEKGDLGAGVGLVSRA